VLEKKGGNVNRICITASVTLPRFDWDAATDNATYGLSIRLKM